MILRLTLLLLLIYFMGTTYAQQRIPGFKIFGKAEGESLKNIPKGFDALHPDADLLKVKTMFFWHHFTDDEVTSDKFVDLVIDKAKVLKPYLDFLNATFFDKEPFIKV